MLPKSTNLQDEQITIWENAVIAAIKSIYNLFKEEPFLIKTEASLQSLIFAELLHARKKKNFDIQSEVSWYKYNDNYSVFRTDLTIMDSNKIVEFSSVVESSRKKNYSKGFRHIGASIGIEIKFCRKEKAQQNQLNEDFDKLRKYSFRYLLTNGKESHPKKFFVIVGCSKQCDFEDAKTNFKKNFTSLLDYFSEKNIKEASMRNIIKPVIFNNERIEFL